MTAPLPHMKLVDAGVPSTQLVQVRRSINVARQRVASADNAEFTQLYWHIRHRISAALQQYRLTQVGMQVLATAPKIVQALYSSNTSHP